MTNNEILKNIVGGKIIDIKLSYEEVIIITDKGTITLNHYQDCCEHVYLEDVCGAPEDCIGETIILFEERFQHTEENRPLPEVTAESYTWTFYELRTTGEDMQFRFLGTSNGYYSEAVSVNYTDIMFEEN